MMDPYNLGTWYSHWEGYVILYLVAPLPETRPPPSLSLLNMWFLPASPGPGTQLLVNEKINFIPKLFWSKHAGLGIDYIPKAFILGSTSKDQTSFQFLNMQEWKWNNLVSLRPNYFIFIGYLKTGDWEWGSSETPWTLSRSATERQTFDAENICKFCLCFKKPSDKIQYSI